MPLRPLAMLLSIATCLDRKSLSIHASVSVLNNVSSKETWQPQSKRQKLSDRSNESHPPPANKLSRIWLTKGAVRELDRKRLHLLQILLIHRTDEPTGRLLETSLG